MNDMDFTTFITALEFSADKHRYERRKDKKKSAYIIHPIQAAELLWNVGGIRDISLLTAALLHDVLEDTPTKDEEIESRFGAKVLAIVKEVSDDKSLPKSEKKVVQLAKVSKISPEAQTLKVADKICNVRDIRLNPPTGLKMPHPEKITYVNWAKQVVDRVRGINPKLETTFDAEFAATMESLISKP
jgi:GTP diphosphokinase / guanosine-3',5'-bis(diphosphate) 3'-diphosphatase